MLFSDSLLVYYPSGFVSTSNILNDFNATNHFIRFLNVIYSLIDFNIDVSSDRNRSFSE